jgi:serine protease Do
MTAAALVTSSALANALSHIAEELRRSTVRILNGRESVGSGVVWSDDGLIITNSHVARSRSVVVEDAGGRRFQARVESRNPRRDLAALRVAANGLHQADTIAPFALRTGDLVVALGNPFGVPGAVVTGIVHSVGPVEDLEQQSWIQADIRLAPGNSGGPLADAQGRVVGINSMIARGLGLAVPSDSVKKFLNGEPDQPEIGVSVQPVALRGPRSGALGLYVSEVTPGGPAARHGIRPGDVLIGYSERPFRRPVDLLVALRSGVSAVNLDVLRGHNRISVQVPLNQ